MKLKEYNRSYVDGLESDDTYFIYNEKTGKAIEVPQKVNKVRKMIIDDLEVSNSFMIRDSLANALKLRELQPTRSSEVDKIFNKNLITLFQAECIREALPVSTDDLQVFVNFLKACPPGYQLSQFIQPHEEFKPVTT